MRFLELFLGAAAATSALAAPSSPSSGEASSKKKRASKFDFVGVNESGGEFGNMNLPGQFDEDYIWPDPSAIDDLIGKGFNIFRIAFMMERLIPDQMTGSINATYEEGLSEIVNYVTSKDAYAIVDPHNFGRYYDQVITDTAGFQAWWKTTAALYADNDKVIFDTNNEYHDMDNSLVAELNQAAINGIRDAGAETQLIFVEGNDWSGAWTWVESGNGESLVNLQDPADSTGAKIIYEMHQYLDSDGSGTHEECVSTTIGSERVAAATEWLKANNKKGIIGETAGGSNQQCISAITDMLSHLQDNSDVWTGWLWWGGGPWWADYMYSMEPPDGAAYTGVLPSLTDFI